MEGEESLDPHDWGELRELGHRMIDEMLTYLETVRERPVWKPLTPEIKGEFKQPLPRVPQGEAQAYEDFRRAVLPNPMGNIHPRFWGWVIGTGTPFGMLAEMLAAGMNPNLGGGDHAANYVEAQVIDWCKEIMGYPPDASGLLVSGGSMANLVGLTVARNTGAGFDIRRDGVGAATGRMMVYASSEVHSSVQKAVELLGMGSESLCLTPVNDRFEIELPALEAAIREDRLAGRQPLCVVGNAGTVNTGAIDNLDALADVCVKEGLWYHVDGAFGALATLAPELRPRLKGIERADSLAFDLHKWMYVPIEVGCALVRNPLYHYRAFSHTPEYLSHMTGGLAGGSIWFSDLGVQLTRGFRALKVWLSFKAHGLDAYARLIQQNVDQAAYLAERIRQTPQLELVAPVPLNIVCFRYVVPGWDDAALNPLNQELLIRLHESGIAAPSYTTLNGRYALRVANVNHRSRREDFDILVDAVAQIGDRLTRTR